MTTYTWPTTAAHPWLPRAQTWRQLHNHRSNVSLLNGYTQTLNLPGARWGCTIEWPAHSYAERALLEGWLARLSGMEHRVSLHDLARPEPQGDILLTGVTAGAASQFAQGLALSNCWPRYNVLTYSQAFDDASWSKVNCSAGASGTTDPLGGGTAERITEDTTAAAGRYVAKGVSWVAGTTYCISVWMREVTAGAKRYAGILVPSAAAGTNTGVQWDIATGIVSATSGTIVASGSEAGDNNWRRVWCAVTATVTVSVGFQIRFDDAAANIAGTWNGDGTSGIHLWGAQVEVGSAPTPYVGFAQLLAGDWLSVVTGAGSQLLQVAEDATASVTGTMTVVTRPMLRSAVSAAAAVTLNKPTALFVLQGSPEMPRDGNNTCPPLAAEFVEVFA